MKKAGGQNRTDDLRFTKPLLYRLSHAGAGAIVAGTRRESSEPCSDAEHRFLLSIPGRLSHAPTEPVLYLDLNLNLNLDLFL